MCVHWVNGGSGCPPPFYFFLDSGTLAFICQFAARGGRKWRENRASSAVQPPLVIIWDDAASWIKRRLAPDFYAMQVCTYKLKDAWG